jgi:hypothetical protein
MMKKNHLRLRFYKFCLISLIFFLIALIFFGPILFSIEDNLYKDNWSQNESYDLNYEDGEEYLDINYFVKEFTSDRYELNTNFLLVLDENINDVWIKNLSINIFLNDHCIESKNRTLTTLKQSYSYVTYIQLIEEIIVKAEGMITIQYNFSSSLHSENIKYSIQVRFISKSEILYKFHLPLIWGEVAYILSLFGISFFIIYLSKVIIMISSSKMRYKKRSEEYYQYLKKCIEKENEL